MRDAARRSVKPLASYRLLLAGAVAFCLVLGGCTNIPPQRWALDRVFISGNRAISDGEIERRIATRETPRFLGLFPGVIYDYEIFDRYVLERDLQRIERYYRSRGFYRARVRAGRVYYTGDAHVTVEVVVEEGEPVRVGRVDVHGLEDLSPELQELAVESIRDVVRVGERFEEEAFARASAELERALQNGGFAYATIRRAADVDITRNLASVGYWVERGPRVRLGEIRITGLDHLPEERVRAALGLEPGTVYSLSSIEAAERAALDLGVFSSVSIEPDPAAVEERREVLPMHVRLEPSRFHTVYFGGGLEIDSQRTRVRLLAGWEDRNFLGGLRSFSVEGEPGVVIHPTRVPYFEPPERLLPMARLRLEFRQPGFIESRTHGLLRGQLSIYPVLLSTERDPDVPILGYRELRVSAGVERSFRFGLFGSLSHNVQLNDPFTYLGTLDPNLGSALVSYPELFVRADFRDSALRPTKGAYLSTVLQAAGLGGEARDVKVQPEGRVYFPLSDDVTLAFRASVGFLFAFNYGETVASNASTGTPGPGVSEADWVRDVQLMFLRGFFAGGVASNRGYGLREIGPHGVVPFYNPGQTTEDVVEICEPSDPRFSAAACDLPLGGLSLWEASAEIRFPIRGPLGGALFLDAADVSPYELDLRLDRPHLSTGLGLRYETPIGPIRLDVGYRIPGLQTSDTAERIPDEIFGLPIAVSFGIGEPF